MEVKFIGGDYGEFLDSGHFQKKLGHRGIEVNDVLDVQLTVSRLNYFQLSEEKNKEMKLIDPNTPFYYFSGEILKLRRDKVKRKIWEASKRKFTKSVEVTSTIMLIHCGIPIRAIIDYWPNNFKEGDFVMFEGGIGGSLITDAVPIRMPIRGKVKEKNERKDYTIHLTLDIESIGELKVEEDYPFWTD